VEEGDDYDDDHDDDDEHRPGLGPVMMGSLFRLAD
jgi:hypothetical protein